MPEKLKRLFLISFVGLMALFLFIAINLSLIAKSGMEFLGSKFLGVPVSVGQVLISPIGGLVRISSLKIRNPKGYGQTYLMELGSISARFSVVSLLQDPVRISSIELNRLRVHWEGGISENNLTKVQENLSRNFPEQKQKSSSAESRSVIIDNLRIAGAEAHLHLAGEKEMVLDLPTIELKNVGNKNKGEAIQKITQVVVARIVRVVVSTIAEKKIENLVGGSEGVGQSILSGIKSIFGR